MEEKTFQGKTIDEAIQTGLLAMGVSTQDEVEIAIIQEPRKGFLGLGGKEAIIKLKPKKITEISEEIKDDVDRSTDVARINDNMEVLENDTVDEDITHKTTSEDEQRDVEFVARYLIDVMAAYLVDISVDVEDLDHRIVYNINTQKPGLVIGKHGKIINALEVLAQTLTHRHVRSRVRVTVNVENYRERRQKTLEKLAERTADEVTINQTTVYLEPLPANERKIIHQALSQYQHIATHSEGREPHRYLVVSYKA